MSRRQQAPISDIAYTNKAVIYDLLFKAAAETLTTIAADPQHLGAHIGLTAVLHTWGSAMTHHPHVHCIVPGGGVSLDGERWVACRKGFFLPVGVLSRLFRRLFLEKLETAHRAGQLQFFSEHFALTATPAFVGFIKPLRHIEWVVYAKRPLAGPEAVLAYLSRYTHRVAIPNSRLIANDERGMTFKWKDYRVPARQRQKTMTLATDEFIRRFLLHVHPRGFHRIRHYGLLAIHQRVRCRAPKHRPSRLTTGLQHLTHIRLWSVPRVALVCSSLNVLSEGMRHGRHRATWFRHALADRVTQLERAGRRSTAYGHLCAQSRLPVLNAAR